jgi:glycosyltransferase involved in cell wall biosynthesis
MERNHLFSVIIPVYNSSYDLEKCLTALSRSSFRDFEAWVVDDGSTEAIEPIVRRFEFDYLRIDGPGGPARARNRGALRASGEYLVFIDADISVHEDTLEQIVATLQADKRIDAVIGCYDDAPEDPSFLSQYKNIFHHYVHQSSHGVVPTFWSGCGAMRRDLFLAVGGFDEERYRRPAIEDIELGTWLSADGHRIWLDSAVQCKHLKRWSWYGLLKTDIFDRGIPWTRLMLRAGEVVNTLNVTWSQRLSVALTTLALVTVIPAIWLPAMWFGVAGILLTVTALNWNFYRYFAERKGWWFAARVLPLHWVYFLYCGVSAAVGSLLHYVSREGSTPSRRQPLTGSHEA